MNNKSLITHMNDSINQLTAKDLSVELVELSEKNLQEIVGGADLDDVSDRVSQELPYTVAVNILGINVPILNGG